MSGTTSSTSNVTINHQRRLRAFIQATQCSFKDFPNWAHAASMSYFMTQPHMREQAPSLDNPEAPPAFDFFIRQEHFSEDVIHMMHRIGYTDDELQSSKCQLTHRNIATQSRQGLLSSEEYLAMLRHDDDLTIRVCHIYIQVRRACHREFPYVG